MAAETWTPAQLPDLSGRTAVVTGASSGLGAVTARELARAGARVVPAVRDPAKGRAVADAIAGDTVVRALDLGDLASVRAFADAWSGPLDILVNNAGIMAVPQGRTADGFELHIGTNHLGHFALTNLLLGHISDRIVTVSSGLARIGRIDLDDLNWQRRTYRPMRAYGQSKLANLLFTVELQRRLTEAGSPVRAPPRTTALIQQLLAASPEFTQRWHQHEIGFRHEERKTIVHPELGHLHLHCQALLATDQAQALLIFTATPGSDSYEKLKLLSVLGTQTR